MIQSTELTPLLRLQGVHGAVWVDHDGCVLLESGYVPDLIAPNAVQLAKSWKASSSVATGDWREVHASGWKLLIASGRSGYLLLVTDEDANLGQIRLASRERMVHLDKLGMSPITSRSGGSEQ